MYINNHTHTHIDTKNNYLDIIEIVGFSCIAFILGVLYHRHCGGTRIN
jgi:hypothetical protein